MSSWQIVCPTVRDDEGWYPNSPSTPGLCVWRNLSTNSWVSLYTNQDISLKMGSPESFQSSTFTWNTFKKRFYPCSLGKLHHYGCESTMSVLLHLIIKSMMYTTCLSVQIDKVIGNLMSWRYWHTHLFCGLTSPTNITYWNFILLKSLPEDLELSKISPKSSITTQMSFVCDEKDPWPYFPFY